MKLGVLLAIYHSNNVIFCCHALPWKVRPELVFHGRAESAVLQQTSRPKSPRKRVVPVLEKCFRLVAFTYTSPKVDMTASKLVPRKEKIGS